MSNDSWLSREVKNPDIKGIGGWLLIFIIVIIGINPIRNAYATYSFFNGGTFELLNSIKPDLKLWVMLYYTVDLLITLFGMICGILLLMKNKSAVSTTKIYLVSVLISRLIEAVFLSQISEGSPRHIEMISITNGIIYFVVWYSYLRSSIRVKNTYGVNI